VTDTFIIFWFSVIIFGEIPFNGVRDLFLRECPRCSEMMTGKTIEES